MWSGYSQTVSGGEHVLLCRHATFPQLLLKSALVQIQIERGQAGAFIGQFQFEFPEICLRITN